MTLTTGGDTIRLDFEDGSAAWAYRTPDGTRYASAGPEADRAVRELWRTKDGYIKLQPTEVEASGETRKPNLLPATQRLFTAALKDKTYAN